ncbi:nitrite reductase (NAD(P)H), small subunit [Xylanimonas cellulosilytica DSM 15894]|uniref:Nitrite reductase (NAD(P)H), small subunit n=1 Tax=Xylanimonas cellulosilytica (strain DSM 15894 / JCM 12276 / CECT 5975 / KCTC 9989 / LMG 20990 / NBRC 107835 / XIL07) TaxID=446471 RepID=D1BSZ2_XYLCX|nr:nitrite reductase small subunit NirD [Xylanimonas cellulosilytica]ACZ30834.1 nitrite reductase (NAD(P)H), small subunit [Xylanimonas cellulosilytica DSM 15894]
MNAVLTPVCPLTYLAVERGAAALVEVDGAQVQVALFRLHDDEVLAVQQADPFSGANVLSRGLVGTRGGEPTVASPVYKQVFALRTGTCLETAGYAPHPGHGPDLTTYEVTVLDGVVHVGGPRSEPDAGDTAGDTAGGAAVDVQSGGTA